MGYWVSVFIRVVYMVMFLAGQSVSYVLRQKANVQCQRFSGCYVWGGFSKKIDYRQLQLVGVFKALPGIALVAGVDERSQCGVVVQQTKCFEIADGFTNFIWLKATDSHQVICRNTLIGIGIEERR